MHKIRYQVRTLSPVLLSTQTGDMNMTATLDYIPGSAILGVLAGRYIQIKNPGKAHKDGKFYNWFLNSGIIFCNAYPCQETEHKTENYLPIPLSLQTEKNKKDRAIDLLRQESKEQMKTISSYGYIAGDTLLKLTPSKSLNFHHARPDRIKGHSIEGKIFNYEAIDPDQLFEGEIIGDKDTLKEFVELVGNAFPVRLGRSRTAQYGQAELKIFSETIEELEVKDDDDLDGEIYLTFLSPAILYNENGFSTTSVDALARYLTEALGTGIESRQIESFKKPVEVENFVSIWRLKRPSEVAFEAGSCFLIQASGWNKSKLIDLQNSGLGERRGEGFGRIALNRWHKEDSYTVKESDKKTKVEKPGGGIPKRIAEIFKEVIKENRRKVIEGKALDKYREFSEHNPPTNALLGRLEMMLKNAENKDQFLKHLANLRNTARDKLEACRGKAEGKDITLLEFIKGSPFENPFSNEMIELKTKLEKMQEEIKYNPSADTEFCKELYKLYWLTFFRMMRKSNKKGGNR